MIKVIVQSKESGNAEEYRQYKQSEIWTMYALAIILGVCFIGTCIAKQYEIGLLFLIGSYSCFSKGRDMSRQNLLIDLIVDLLQALNEKDGEND